MVLFSEVFLEHQKLNKEGLRHTLREEVGRGGKRVHSPGEQGCLHGKEQGKKDRGQESKKNYLGVGIAKYFKTHWLSQFCATKARPVLKGIFLFNH